MSEWENTFGAQSRPWNQQQLDQVPTVERGIHLSAQIWQVCVITRAIYSYSSCSELWVSEELLTGMSVKTLLQNCQRIFGNVRYWKEPLSSIRAGLNSANASNSSLTGSMSKLWLLNRSSDEQACTLSGLHCISKTQPALPSSFGINVGQTCLVDARHMVVYLRSLGKGCALEPHQYVV